jgi:hypothetical protein
MADVADRSGCTLATLRHGCISKPAQEAAGSSALPVAQQPLPARMYYPLLYLSALPLGISLLGLFARLVGRSRVLGGIGYTVVGMRMLPHFYETFHFGSTGASANELAALVVRGIKTATSDLL